MTRLLTLLVMSVVALVATADEYIDPQTNVIYTYEPGQTTASVKAGREETTNGGYGSELQTIIHPGSPKASGDVMILDRFTVGTTEYVVTSIGEFAFYDNATIKSVSIPKTVTDIGDFAFQGCNNLIEMQLPEGLTQISNGLFSGCDKLVSVVIPSSVCRIEARAFSGCSSLTSITLPDGLTYAGIGAFSGTPWYASMYDKAPDGPFYLGPLLLGYKGDKPTGELVIKEGTTCVGYEAFINCKSLTSITVPPSVTYVDFDAFYGCNSLTAVHITDLAAWCGIEFQDQGLSSSSNPLFYAHHLYLDDKKVTDLVIPEGVTSIGDFAFDYCTDLTSVTIPDGVTNIGSCAFRGCEKLTNVAIPPSVATIGSLAFIWCKKMETVHISDLAAWCGISFYRTANPLYYGAHLYLNDKLVTDLTIPDGVTSIGDGAFIGCSYLSNVTIPEGVTTIGELTFRDCSGLTSISLPTSLNSIGTYAFQNCSSLTSINIPEGVTSIGEWTFADCSSLTSITIPASVKSIDHGAFRGCWGLESVISWIEEPFVILDDVFELFDDKTYALSSTPATLYVPKGCKERYESTAGWSRFTNIREINDIDTIPQMAYRPFVEDGKVWAVKVGSDTLPIEEWIEYYYFDGDTIIDGRTAKRMVGDRISYGQYTTGEYIGAWYEQDKKVYFAFRGKQQFELIYDFTLSTDDSIFHDGYTWVLNKVSEGTLGFKGRYYDFSLGCWHDNVITARWFEGVGSRTYPWLYQNMSEGPVTLLACSVGDEVIYYNSDEGNPYFIGARKQRIDFTHTIKIKPKARKRSEAAQSLYGEYNDLLLGIRLDPLDDAYQVCITDEAGKAFYEKTVNAGSIVGLNIDIAAYAAGRYTVTVENSQEAFTGQFEAQATGIEEAKSKRPEQTGSIYNLQGQRVSTLQKGLNIVNGQKVYVR